MTASASNKSLFVTGLTRKKRQIPTANTALGGLWRRTRHACSPGKKANQISVAATPAFGDNVVLVPRGRNAERVLLSHVVLDHVDRGGIVEAEETLILLAFQKMVLVLEVKEGHQVFLLEQHKPVALQSLQGRKQITSFTASILALILQHICRLENTKLLRRPRSHKHIFIRASTHQSTIGYFTRFLTTFLFYPSHRSSRRRLQKKSLPPYFIASHDDRLRCHHTRCEQGASDRNYKPITGLFTRKRTRCSTIIL